MALLRAARYAPPASSARIAPAASLSSEVRTMRCPIKSHGPRWPGDVRNCSIRTPRPPRGQRGGAGAGEGDGRRRGRLGPSCSALLSGPRFRNCSNNGWGTKRETRAGLSVVSASVLPHSPCVREIARARRSGVRRCPLRITTRNLCRLAA